MNILFTTLRVKAHVNIKLNVFTLNNVYLSIRLSSSLHLVIFVAPSFHFINTFKRSFPLAFNDYIMMGWSQGSNLTFLTTC